MKEKSPKNGLRRWDNAVNGAKQLIRSLRQELQDNEDVMLVIFFFNTSVNENIYEQNLSMDVPEEIFT